VLIARCVVAAVREKTLAGIQTVWNSNGAMTGAMIYEEAAGLQPDENWSIGIVCLV
jgi:hypothetical protein